MPPSGTDTFTYPSPDFIRIYSLMSAIKFDYPTYKLFEVSHIRTHRLRCYGRQFNKIGMMGFYLWDCSVEHVIEWFFETNYCDSLSTILRGRSLSTLTRSSLLIR